MSRMKLKGPPTRPLYREPGKPSTEPRVRPTVPQLARAFIEGHLRRPPDVLAPELQGLADMARARMAEKGPGVMMTFKVNDVALEMPAPELVEAVRLALSIPMAGMREIARSL